ncbi:MAG: hypothetical protein N3B15_02960, partial [Planctomycetota bacterium]|nr:hypothetical protein [Planctomycetota bacterium]
MSIERLIHRRIRLRRPLLTARGAIAERSVWLVQIGRGWGEAAPLPGFGGELPERCAWALERLQRLGIEPDAETPCARAAVDGARRAEAAARSGRPLAGRSGTVALCRLHDDDGEAPPTAPCVKLKSCGDVRRDAERVRRLLARAPQLRVRLDANGAWSVADAHLFTKLAASAVEFVEQPLPDQALEACAALRRAGLRIALDESVRSAADLARAIALRAADAVVLKPNWLGGWEPTERLVAMAQLSGLAVILSSALGT